MVAVTAPAPNPARPELRVLPSRRRPRYGARRAVALGLLVAVLALSALLADSALDALAAEPGGAPAPAGADGVAATETVVVQPGDTLWSIATEVAPGRDPRAVVDELAERNGVTTPDAGQRLEVP